MHLFTAWIIWLSFDCEWDVDFDLIALQFWIDCYGIWKQTKILDFFLLFFPFFSCECVHDMRRNISLYSKIDLIVRLIACFGFELSLVSFFRSFQNILRWKEKLHLTGQKK